jgi:hypothetical protein
LKRRERVKKKHFETSQKYKKICIVPLVFCSILITSVEESGEVQVWFYMRSNYSHSSSYERSKITLNHSTYREEQQNTAKKKKESRSTTLQAAAESFCLDACRRTLKLPKMVPPT